MVVKPTVALGQPCQMLLVEDRGAAVRAREDVDDPVHVLTPGGRPRVGKPRGFLRRAALSCYPTRCRWGRVTLTPTGTHTARRDVRGPATRGRWEPGGTISVKITPEPPEERGAPGVLQKTFGSTIPK